MKKLLHTSMLAAVIVSCSTVNAVEQSDVDQFTAMLKQISVCDRHAKLAYVVMASRQMSDDFLDAIVAGRMVAESYNDLNEDDIHHYAYDSFNYPRKLNGHDKSAYANGYKKLVYEDCLKGYGY